jgi:hypothetical protein
MALTDRISKIIDKGVKDAHSYAIFEMKRHKDDNYPEYAITVAGTEDTKGWYAISEIKSLLDAKDIAERLPAPNETISGARLISATDIEFDGDVKTKTHYFFLENKSDKGNLDFSRMYDLAGLGAGEPVETEARRPDLLIVADDETHNWNDRVVALVGRVKGVYGVNRGETNYSQVWMEFLSNQCERPFYDLEEAEKEQEFRKIKYDTMTDFEMDNTGDHGRESTRWAVSRMEILTEISPSADWLVEYMLEPEEGARDQKERDLYGEYQANGLPGVHFEDQRTDAEIVAAGKALLEERGISEDEDDVVEESAAPDATI